jgi:hypothetical protein
VDIPFGEDYNQQEKHILQQLGGALDGVENPLKSVQDLKKRGALTLVLPKDMVVSDRKLNQKELPSVRELRSGNYGEKRVEETTDKLFFVSYLTEHFSNLMDSDETKSLFYEQEYLIGGRASDRANLEQVCQEILQIRLAVNYAYLCTDAAKKAEAERKRQEEVAQRRKEMEEKRKQANKKKNKEADTKTDSGLSEEEWEEIKEKAAQRREFSASRNKTDLDPEKQNPAEIQEQMCLNV